LKVLFISFATTVFKSEAEVEWACAALGKGASEEIVFDGIEEMEMNVAIGPVRC